MRLKLRSFINALAGGAAAGVLHRGHSSADEANTVTLPKPVWQNKGTLKDALTNRMSTRAFSDKALPLETLSLLLWAAFGINRNDSANRTAPSALNKQEIDIYVAIADGLYLYNPVPHSLSEILNKDIRSLTGTQRFVKNAPVNLIYVSDFSKSNKSSKKKRDYYSAANTGYISQNVYLFCAAEGLATVVRGSISRFILAKAMNLRKDQGIILAQTIGYPKSE